MRVCVFSLLAGVEVKMGIVVISNATIPGGTAPPGVPVLLYKQLSG